MQVTIFDLLDSSIEEIKPAFEIRTLLNPDRGILGDYVPNHFCSVAGEGVYRQPYLSQHHVYLAGRYLGSVWRDLEGDSWSYAIAGGSDKLSGHNFDRACAELYQSWKDDRQYWQDFFARWH